MDKKKVKSPSVVNIVDGGHKVESNVKVIGIPDGGHKPKSNPKVLGIPANFEN